ncbi:uncharacterized protein LOC119634044 [Glossina fuscipes]|uniref:Uncharacterized protein LOC119634044 n=1 Tax=Glossina fuscipes TaxID=7396 RepID=A0A8U0WFY9_9MUSC|nr:uncharacterized protein LOC119634044 [Glossina fuscipes]KAI9585132.1 hypothetical protein GQX74_000979 [Glossina fuscipes]
MLSLITLLVLISAVRIHGQRETSNQEVTYKINWLPVWDDIGGNGGGLGRHHSEKDICASSIDGGLKKHIQQAKALLPLDKIKELIDGAANDPEMIALQKLRKSPEFRNKLQALRSSQEYQRIKDYICQILHLDLIYYKQFLSIFLLPSAANVVKADGEQSSKGGIYDVITKIYNILPRQELIDLYQRLLKTDPEFAKSIDNIKSSEFLQLIENLKINVKEYKELRQQLTNIGVPIDTVQRFIRTILGWDLDSIIF